MKPCIIIPERIMGRTRYTAISEHLSKITFNGGQYQPLANLLEKSGYQIMPLNSRFARTILDKLEGQSV